MIFAETPVPRKAPVLPLFTRPRPRPALRVPAGVRTATIAALANVTMSTAQSWRSGRHAPQPRHRAWIELVQRLLAEAGLRS